jgi:hypothetical protein
MLTLDQVLKLPPGILHVNDILPTPIDQSEPNICKDIFNKVTGGEISLRSTHTCFLWELRPSQQQLITQKLRWIQAHYDELQPIVVMDYQKKLFIIDGHHRASVAHLRHQKEITCHIVRVDFKTVRF